jgi:hypothetical protein
MPELVFQEEGHIYRLGDEVLPSVTTVLKEAGLYNFSFGGGEYHMDLGKYVHSATEYLDNGDLDEDALDDTIKPYIKAYKKFKAEAGFKIRINEQRLHHNAWLFAGTIDREGDICSTPALVDIKTGGEQLVTPVQLAAYRMLLDNADHKCHRAYSLHLKNNGTYTLKEAKDYMKNRGIFLAALSLYKWKLQNNLLSSGG